MLILIILITLIWSALFVIIYQLTRKCDPTISLRDNFLFAAVALALLIFFSTETGDAWLLDYKDSLALCLAIAGEKQPVRIVETPEKFAIEWNANYQIEEDKFVVLQKAGQVRTILGYPTEEILNTIQQVFT